MSWPGNTRNQQVSLLRLLPFNFRQGFGQFSPDQNQYQQQNQFQGGNQGMQRFDNQSFQPNRGGNPMNQAPVDPNLADTLSRLLRQQGRDQPQPNQFQGQNQNNQNPRSQFQQQGQSPALLQQLLQHQQQQKPPQQNRPFNQGQFGGGYNDNSQVLQQAQVQQQAQVVAQAMQQAQAQQALQAQAQAQAVQLAAAAQLAQAVQQQQRTNQQQNFSNPRGFNQGPVNQSGGMFLSQILVSRFFRIW